MADGQVTKADSIIVKSDAKKLRRIGKDGSVIVGFSGGVADAITLYNMLVIDLKS